MALGLLVVIAAAAAAHGTWCFQSVDVHHDSTIEPSSLSADVNAANLPSFTGDLKDSAQRASNSFFRTASWRTPPIRNPDSADHKTVDGSVLAAQFGTTAKASVVPTTILEKNERRSLLSPNREVAVYRPSQEITQMGSTAMEISKPNNELHVLYSATRHGIERANSWLDLSGPALGLSATLGAVGLAVGVPYMPGLTDNIALALVGAVVPLLNGQKVILLPNFIPVLFLGLFTF